MSIEGTLYSTGISLYRAGVRIAGLWNKKARLLNAGHREIESRLRAAFSPGDRPVWVHAASLGEFEQGLPLIEKIRSEQPDCKILVTFYSPSGYEVRKDFAGVDCVTYLPFDTPARVKRFLDLVNPQAAVFVKYEIWRNYLCELDRRDIPTYLISATFRPEQKFFNPKYKSYGSWLRHFDRIFVQDEGSRTLLGSIGLTDVEVSGDTRFDRVTEIKSQRRDIPAIERFKEMGRPRMTILAGSSWPKDEELYADWINRHPEVKLIIAPHEFDDNRLNTLKGRFTGGAVLLSELEGGDAATDASPQVLILDCFGLLSSAYSYCDVAYIGGGFGDGIHNINEPAVYAVPVIFGPNNHKFIEAKEMTERGGAIEVSSKRQLEGAFRRMLEPTVRRQRGVSAEYYIKSKIGATDKIYRKIFE